MIRLLTIVISIGLADSLNPSTIGPALYIASGERHARRDVIQFSIAVFIVYFVGGLAIALGPGQLLLSIVPKPSHLVRHILEILAGCALLFGGLVLWHRRERLAKRNPPRPNPGGKSSALLGATIIAVELPTAFPYFAAIAAIVGSDINPLRQVFLLLVFNVCFVLPLIVIVLILFFGGERSRRILTAVREFLDRRWPEVLAVIGLVAGAFVILLGATGLAGRAHGHVGRFFRHFRKILTP